MALGERANKTVEVKSDRSLVTSVDRMVEDFLLKELSKLTPGVGFWGEETGRHGDRENGLWVLDPIDGTTNYVYDQPIWGITAGLVVDNQIRLGVTAMPDLGSLLSASLGGGCFCNGERLPQVESGEIKPYHLVGHGDSYMALAPRSPGKMRHIGSFSVESAFVAMQKLRALTTARVRLYDAAGGVLLCREVGCVVKDMDGSDWSESEWLGDDRVEPFFIGPADSNFPFGN